MGDSAGGQAILLLYLCLMKIIGYANAGLIKSRPSSAMLPLRSLMLPLRSLMLPLRSLMLPQYSPMLAFYSFIFSSYSFVLSLYPLLLPYYPPPTPSLFSSNRLCSLSRPAIAIFNLKFKGIIYIIYMTRT